LAAGVLTDVAGNTNDAVSQFAITSDLTVPTVTLTASDDSFATTLSTNDYSNKKQITWKFTLSEPPQPKAALADSDLTKTNCLNGLFTGNDLTWYLRCDANPGNDITVTMAAAAFTDAGGNDNAAPGAALVVKSDNVKPTVTITALDTDGALTNAAISSVAGTAAITFTFTLSEVSTDFIVGDVTASGCTTPTFVTTNAPAPAPFVYLLKCDGADGTDVKVALAAGVLTDVAGNTNDAVSQFGVTSDSVAPTVAITATETTTAATALSTGASTSHSVLFKFTMSKDTTNFVVGDVTVSNCGSTNSPASFTGFKNMYYMKCSYVNGLTVSVNVETAKFTAIGGVDNTAASAAFTVVFT